MGPQLLSNVRGVIIVFLPNAIKIHHPVIHITQDAASFPIQYSLIPVFRPVKEVAGPDSKLSPAEGKDYDFLGTTPISPKGTEVRDCFTDFSREVGRIQAWTLDCEGSFWLLLTYDYFCLNYIYR